MFETSADPLLRKAFHHRDDAAIDFADDVLGGDAHITEEELTRVRLGPSELATAVEPRRAGLDREQRDALGALLRIRARRNDDEIGANPVGDEHL